jgi:DNA polymerase-3 subunit chi
LAAAAARQVDFYILPGTEPRARLKYACRMAEMAYLAGHHVLVCCDDAAQLQSFDELLWTFADRSFVPHEIYSDAAQWQHTPVLLGLDPRPAQPYALLLNLATEVPAAAALADRIAEIVDAGEARRRSGRQRFRQYREAALSPVTHNIAADDASQAL